jgi:hypothetical protein
MASVVAVRVTVTGRCRNPACAQAGKKQHIRYLADDARAIPASQATCRACGQRLRR